MAGTSPAHDVLGIIPGTDRDEVRAAFQERVKDAHPDHGGSEAELSRVQRARERLLDR